MDLGLVTAGVLAAMVALMLMRLPLAVVTFTVAIGLVMMTTGPAGLRLVASRISTLALEYSLVAVPFFVLMASILERSGVARDLYAALHLWSGRLRGGVAIQTLLLSVVMAAMMGVAGGEIVILGLVALPQMLKLGYDRRLAMGTICAGGSLGSMIPPSVVLIFYGLMAGTSIGDLFLAAIGPGMLLALFYIAYVVLRTWLDPASAPIPADSDATASRAEKLAAGRAVVLPILLIAVVLGTIYSGIATVTEAAGIGAIGALAIALLRRELDLPGLRGALLQTLSTCGNLIWLTFGATALIGAYNLLGGTTYLQGVFAGMDLPPMGIILVMVAILLVLGCFMDWIGICLLVMPVFVPVVRTLGYDPVWFGIVFCVAMQIAYISPPFGPSCFYLKGVAPPDVTLPEIFRSVLPFIAVQILVLALLLAVPDLALFLPAAAR